MRSVAEHQEAVRLLLAPLADRDPELVGLEEARRGGSDRVLATDLRTSLDHPPFDNSQMDGYAVRSADLTPGAALRVAPRIAAGHPGAALAAGAAAPIMTGAPLPEGADAVVPIEAATPDAFLPEGAGQTVRFAARPDTGAFVRGRGSDLPAGSVLLAAGSRLGPAQWGVIAASGITSVPVLRRIRVLVLSTGDELRAAGEPLGPGQVHDANSAALAAAVRGAGAEVTETLTLGDDAATVRPVLARAATGADLLLTSGGVSKGAYEVVRDVFEDAGVLFDSVAMQPGGPQGIGLAALEGQDGHRFTLPVVAFPGNPVSALVSFEMFLRPVLRRLHGLRPDRRSFLASLADGADSPPAKHQVRRGRLDADGRVELVGGPSSHLLHGYASSTVLVHLPVGAARLQAGASVEVWDIDE